MTASWSDFSACAGGLLALLVAGRRGVFGFTALTGFSWSCFFVAMNDLGSVQRYPVDSVFLGETPHARHEKHKNKYNVLILFTTNPYGHEWIKTLGAALGARIKALIESA